MKQLHTDLLNYRLRYDGAAVISPEQIADTLLKGVSPAQLRLVGSSPDIDTFNLRADEGDELRPDGDPVKVNLAWKLPEKYLNLDIYQTVGAAYEAQAESLHAIYTPQQYDLALTRLTDELAEFERRGMVPFLRTIIYVLDVFRQEGVVWGVGRGSSCASYVLFILGLHAVDCIFYDVPASEFFHD